MIRFPSKISFFILVFGMFAVLCQLTFTLLYMDHFHPTASPSVLLHTFAHYIEHILASLALISAGAFVIDYVLLKDTNEN